MSDKKYLEDMDSTDLADLQRALEELRADPRLQCPLDGPGSHRLDLKELRSAQIALETAQERIGKLEDINADLRYSEDEARAEIAKARTAMGDGADDSRWEPGTTAVDALIAELAEYKIARSTGKEWMAQIASLNAELQALRLAEISREGQCIEEHHWKGNCPMDGAVAAAHAERDMHWKARLHSAKVNAMCNCAPDGWTLECGCPGCPCRCHGLEAERDAAIERAEMFEIRRNGLAERLDAARASALEEAAKFLEVWETDLSDRRESWEAIRAFARDGVAPKGAP